MITKREGPPTKKKLATKKDGRKENPRPTNQKIHMKNIKPGSMQRMG
jgi:hypothetical protein